MLSVSFQDALILLLNDVYLKEEVWSIRRKSLLVNSSKKIRIQSSFSEVFFKSSFSEVFFKKNITKFLEYSKKYIHAESNLSKAAPATLLQSLSVMGTLLEFLHQFKKNSS